MLSPTHGVSMGELALRVVVKGVSDADLAPLQFERYFVLGPRARNPSCVATEAAGCAAPPTIA
jgi:hypothetical protein